MTPFSCVQASARAVATNDAPHAHMRPALLWRGSYDYERALSEVLPAVAAKKIAKGGFMVLRPDSGDAIQTVVMGLRAAEKVFGCDTIAKGFKVPRGCSVIQGACAARYAAQRGRATRRILCPLIFSKQNAP